MAQKAVGGPDPLTSAQAGDDQLTPVEDDQLTPVETGELVNVAVQTLANWRAHGKGPRYSKLSEGRSGRVRYRRSDVLAWLAERQVPVG